MRSCRAPRNHHDAFARRVFSRKETVAILLRRLLPTPCLELLDLTTLRLEPSAHVDPELGTRYSDRLFSVALRGTGRRIGIYLALEHQSEPEALMPWRELVYLVDIWREHLDEAPRSVKRLPLIVPIVLLQHRARSTPTRFSEILDLPSEALAVFGPPLELRLLVDDLSGSVLDDPDASQPTRAFVELARVLLHAYANPQARIEQRVEELARLFDDLPDPNDSDDAKTIWSYIVAAYGIESSIFQAIRDTISPRSREMLEMINNQWFQDGRTQGFVDGRTQGFVDGRTQGFVDGRTQGFADGRTQGFVEARARALLDVLESRALRPSTALRERVLSTADPQQLERWFRRALTAGSVDEIFRAPEP
ncbi:Rpn family recombination-promoting nuclease/putative transposase [Paraliomyxa miuraensis]|uniref:Rpn family recombination-promoting nuclease/putative transposase n=1 Tax=Paraliomyxa miuraensis TaxID=376150 RepID=UPI002258761F|nr:Rpn family recombination-promoting nuclease/putative transposase [Paraliomyxa miuraensis]MCX4240344.1 Rpn family recombination-promoting nuclease/putative transposase [Paraliomyxa miuraensis]